MSTYASIRLHIIFSTKHREETIHDDWRDRLHAYMGGIVRHQEALAEAIGGTNDHVHLLISLKTKHCPADFVRDLKKASSAWVRDEFRQDFTWQEGYACIAVSPRDKPMIVRYIENQVEHHRQIDSKAELRQLLEEAGIEIDERYFA